MVYIQTEQSYLMVSKQHAQYRMVRSFAALSRGRTLLATGQVVLGLACQSRSKWEQLVYISPDAIWSKRLKTQRDQNLQPFSQNIPYVLPI